MLRIPSPDDVLHGPVVAGVDIGGTKITAVLADVDGNVLAFDTTALGCGGVGGPDVAVPVRPCSYTPSPPPTIRPTHVPSDIIALI